MLKNINISFSKIMLTLIFIIMSGEIVLLTLQNRKLEKLLVEERETKNPQGIKIGTPAPDITATLSDGKTINIDIPNIDSTIVLLFFKPSCPACVDDFSNWVKLDSLSAEKPLKLVGICKDNYLNTMTYIKEKNIQFPVIADSTGEIVKKYKIKFVPYKVVIDKTGNVVSTSSYHENDKMFEIIDTLLAKN